MSQTLPIPEKRRRASGFTSGMGEELFSTSRRGYRASGIEAFCIIARRLSTPCVWSDLEKEFGRSVSALCEIFYETTEQLYKEIGHLVEEFKAGLIIERCEEYATKVFESGAPLDSCVGFVDGTNVFIAQPGGDMQREAYNGHKSATVSNFRL